MSKIENRCIAYIYNEMDPSERLEFERELQDDENLLIELETLKKTACSLKKLGSVEPPEFVINKIKQRASSNNGTNRGHDSYKYLFISAAVTLLAVMVYGSTIVRNNASVTHINHSNSETSEASFSSNGNISSVSAGSEEQLDDISPWIDHEEVIHFHERFNKGSIASVDSMFNHSLKKLTRVSSSNTVPQVQQQIHLTGSGSNR